MCLIRLARCLLNVGFLTVAVFTLAVATPALIVLLACGTVTGQPNPDYELTLTDAGGPTGSDQIVRVLLDDPNANLALEGWSYGVCHLISDVVVLSEEQGETVMGLQGGLGPSGYFVTIFGAQGLTVNCVISFTGADVLRPGSNYELQLLTYRLLGSSGTNSTVMFCDGLIPPMSPPIETVLMGVGMVPIVPVQNPGTIQIMDGFLRGDADGNGTFSGLLDALYLLNFGFIQGPPPPCLEAADADGNGVFQALFDGLHILNHQFLGGPAPPPPYPNCGSDPDPATNLGCFTNGCP